MLRVIASLLIVAALGLGIAGWYQGTPDDDAVTGPPAEVNVTAAVIRPLIDRLEVTGTARAGRAITLVTEVDGRVTELHFHEGQSVEAGALLVSLDDRQARMDLERARADYQGALSDYQEAARRLGTRAVSQAEVNTLKTALEDARTGLDARRVALEDHSIRAPFDGVMGLRQVHPGAYLRSGDPIATLDSVRNLEVSFQAPERYRVALRPGLDVTFSSDAHPHKQFAGKVMVFNGQADGDGAGLAIKAMLDNGEALLRPGEVLRVSMLFGEHAALLVPEQAIVTSGARSFVFTITTTQRAERRAVQLGGRRDGWVEVVAGLSEAEPVIVSGHLGLGSGAPVTVLPDGLDRGAWLPSWRTPLEAPV
ncbi:efflux RND transporter periplasmic adaptor subunit [Alloalcanivorax marinus]|uniref:efflux RND transporter periplasmic adaptor subunit n=1 Tax=Alloalcanivorax marinus TaxID=1177169 RepID=UPI0019574C3E|nr:efflux RND transporter periplasmic adaptor subunit [Alloalcanivorax marinus]MBM7332188.1 efflux RND transporter periplasmic adaptor subunit [Alloalcanivorax marinus]